MMTKLEQRFNISRDPKDYRRTKHYLHRLSQRKVIEEDMVTEAIEEGEVIEVKPDEDWGGKVAVIQHRWLNTTFKVVVNITKGAAKTTYEVES